MLIRQKMEKNVAVIFDMDGVLVDSNPYHKVALIQFCAKYGYSLSDTELVEKIYGRTNKEWLTNLFGVLTPAQLLQYAEEKELIYRQLHQADIKPVKGLIPFLNLLEENHIPKAIGTSAPRGNVDFILSHTATEKYFPVILHDTFVTRGKPDPEIYLKAIATLKMPAEKCIVIEDSLSGIAAGKASGAKVIGITTTHTREEMQHTDWIIDDFDDLSLTILEKIVAS